MSMLGDILFGMRTVIDLSSKVEGLIGDVRQLAGEVRNIDRRLVRVETIIEVTRSDGATLRIARDPDDKP